MQVCTHCNKSFNHLIGDHEFYQQIEVPAPKMCPDCRQQLRISFRNERNLYSNTCAQCKKNIITHFSGDKPFPILCPECWWGDSWDGLSYGKEIDFSRPFFDQFEELFHVIPRPSLNNGQPENADYCNQCVRNKNSYLLFAADDNEDCMYGYWINRCIDTFNSSNLADCTLCIDLIDSENCYQCIYSQDLKNCSDCLFSFNLIGCNNCFRCAGLRNKEYYFENQPCPPAEYKQKLEKYGIHKRSTYDTAKQNFTQTRNSIPHKYAHIINTEHCTGDYLINSKDSLHCFDIFDAEQCRYTFNLVHKHFNIRDVSYSTESRNIFQSHSITGEDIYFCNLTWFSSNVWYSDLVMSSQDIFGCVGLKHQHHCILNKQYSPEEYASIRTRLIEHMKSTGEWGQFFPAKYSPFAYNETVTQDFFPLTKEAAIAQGFQWRDEKEHTAIPQSYTIPDSIHDVPNTICNELLTCSSCKHNFKILPGELQIYKQLDYPIPHMCHECRFQERLALRNHRTLFPRKCSTCQTPVQSTYAPERPEEILCEECYLKRMY